MQRTQRVLFGPLAAGILLFGIAGLALLVPGYSHVHQTVSEIGEVGSPARIPFAILLCCVAICLLVFASGIRDVSHAAGRSPFAAYLVGCMAVSTAGVGVFAFPHPLHNVFGISELIGYLAPPVLAITWRRAPQASALVAFSWVMTAVLWSAIALNLSSLGGDSSLWHELKPVYGVVQRALFAAWFGWCAGVGVLMAGKEGEAVRQEQE